MWSSLIEVRSPQADERGEEGWVGHQRIYFRVTALAEHRSRIQSRSGAPGEIIETDWMDMFIVRDSDGHEVVDLAADSTKHTIDPW